MKFYFLVFILTTFSLVSLSTQEVRAQSDERSGYYQDVMRFGIGAQAGLMSGMGLGVRVHPAGRMGAQLAGGAISGGEGVAASIGFEGQYDFDWRDRSRFFGFIGMGYYTNGEEELTKEEWEQGEEDPRLKSAFRAGFGLGYEWDISNVLIFSANIAFTYFSEGMFLPLPQVGLYYLFD
ncbi:MAG: hypothetical protein KFH87_04635 [Bacteroidetes bacterium]|nr:hypothetical protein [Bacteroidota bacterium]